MLTLLKVMLIGVGQWLAVTRIGATPPSVPTPPATLSGCEERDYVSRNIFKKCPRVYTWFLWKRIRFWKWLQDVLVMALRECYKILNFLIYHHWLDHSLLLTVLPPLSESKNLHWEPELWAIDFHITLQCRCNYMQKYFEVDYIQNVFTTRN